MAGVRTEAHVTLKIDGKTAAFDRGELQLTDYGISGIPVFQISRYAARALHDGRKVTAQLDVCPELTFKELNDLLRDRRDTFGYRPAQEFLHGVLNSKLGKLF